jgi:hypothetical protein
MFAMAGRGHLGSPFLEGELGGFSGDIEDNRSTRSKLYVEANKVDIIPIDDGRENRRTEVDRKVRERDRNPISRCESRPVIRRQ